MIVGRREFLKLSAMTAGGMLLPPELALAGEQVSLPLHKPIGEAQTICPYCSVGCGLIVATGPDGHITNTEGDPDHVTNRGALDPKSVSVTQLSTSPHRLRKPLYRAPGASGWQEMEWDEILPRIARRIKETRGATFEEKEGEVMVNRTRAIGFLGGVLEQTAEPIFLVHDNAPYHRAAKLKRFAKDNASPLTVYHLPSYSPDYNPIEVLRRAVKRCATHNRYLPTLDLPVS